MTVVNRRNALVGWLVLRLVKWAAKEKAKAAVPGSRTSAGVAAGAAALVGVLVFLHHRKNGDDG